MFDLGSFSLSDMTRCSADLRKLGGGAKSMEEAAERITAYLYNRLLHGPDKKRSCALVRFYKTHTFEDLAPELQEFASASLGQTPKFPGMRCLTLLSTVGDEPSWNSRELSRNHRAIPLPSAEIIARLPMIAQLFTQFGIELSTVVRPDPALILDLDQKTYNVFHVEQAEGSPYIPAQEEFVIPHKIRSSLGFGGILPSGHLFAVIMFTRIRIPRATADLFKPLALSAKMAVLSFEGGQIFRRPA